LAKQTRHNSEKPPPQRDGRYHSAIHHANPNQGWQPTSYHAPHLGNRSTTPWAEVDGSRLQSRGRAGQGAVTKRCLRHRWASRNADPTRSRRVRCTVNECSRR